MKKNDYVEFTGLLPKELQGTKKKPIYGTVEKLIGKTKVVVKPRYKRFTVVVNLADLTKVAYEAFHKSQKKVVKKAVAKKSVAKPKAKNEMKPCETKKVLKPKNPGIVKAVAKAKYPIAEEPTKPKHIIGVDPAGDGKPVVFKIDKDNIEQVPLDDVKEPVEVVAETNKPKYDWNQDKPVNETPDAKPTIDPWAEEEAVAHGRGAVVWTVILILLGVAVVAYFTLR